MAFLTHPAITFSWITAETLILSATIHRSITWKEYRAAVRQASRMIESQNEPVNLIIEIATRGNVVPPAGAARQLAQTLDEQVENCGVCVLVSAPVLLQSTIQLSLVAMGRFASVRVYFVETLDEALTVVRHFNTKDSRATSSTR